MTSALHSAPLQSAMSYFNTLLTQPDPGPLQKPLPNAPSAPIAIAQPPSKASATVKDPTNAFNSLLAASPPTNPGPDLCEVCMLPNNLLAIEYSFIHSQSCHARTKYNDGTKTHDFCSKRCAATAQNKVNGTSSRKPSKGPVAPGNCDV
jgi:hypothetical protein